MTPAQIHNRNAAAIVQQIIKPTLDAGGEMTDVLVLLESVILEREVCQRQTRRR